MSLPQLRPSPDARKGLGPLLRLGLFVLCALAAPSASADSVPPLVGTLCAKCHGADGNSTDPTYPKLAGQPAAYLAKQIGEFIAGSRRHDLMSPVAAQLKPEEIEAVADYFSRQRSTSGPPGDATLTEIGQLLYTIGNPATGLPSCDGCHSPDGSGGGRFPRLAGQHREYLAKQLEDIREGRRTSSTLMRAVAERMGPIEVRAMSVYLSGR